jgi:hypothetical protein
LRRFVVSVAALGTFLCPAVATSAPISGVYSSVDLGGSLFTGRSSASRTGAADGLPHVLHVQSWDGVALGTQWRISCGTESVPSQVEDGRDAGGTGPVITTSTFDGGTFWFGPGPWGDGSGEVDATVIVSTIEFAQNSPISARANIHVSGSFLNGCELTFLVSNGIGVGETPAQAKPATYPAFLDDSCQPNGQLGIWGDVVDLTFMILCSTQNLESTWGRMKSAYR